MISTPDQRLRVFVSSTLKELEKERKAARDAIESLRLSPVLFELAARPYAARELYRSYLKQSHIFIGIYWQSYGWVAPGMEVSGIEDEYMLSEGKPRLVYIKAQGERDEKLKAMLDRIKDDDVSFKYFSDPEELSEQIQMDLAILLSEKFQQERNKFLPLPSCPIVGREESMKTVEDYLAGGIRIVTVTGPAGVGKTRLAIEIAQKAKDAAWVSLDREKEVIPAAARVLGEDPKVYGKKMLLVLDNFEHLIDQAHEISALLSSNDNLSMLITSRTPLRIYGEYEVKLEPLPLGCGSVLFTEFAKVVDPGFSLDEENSTAVEEIVTKLDGIPLAIELAACRTNAFSPQEILRRLGIGILTNRQRDAPERHRTMEKAIGWSYDLLEPGARELFIKLGSMKEFTLEDAERVSEDAFERLQTLVDSSLVCREGEMYRMLGMTREYAVSQIA